MASYWLRRDRDKKKVILDSSSIMMLFEFSINLEDELYRLVGKHEILIPKQVIDELNFLSLQGKGMKRIKAKASLQLIKKYKTMNIKTAKEGDEAIIEIAEKTRSIVVTNDKELRKKLKKIPVEVIYLRGKLEME